MAADRPTTPSTLESVLADAQRLHRANDLAGAERQYLRALEAMPAHADAWHLAGVVAYQLGRPSDAIARYRKAVELRPDFAAAHNNLALALKATGQLDDAQGAYETALERDPSFAAAAYNLALLHEARRNLASAEAMYRRALSLRADWPEALGNLGNLLRRLARANDAAVVLERALSLAPSDANALGNLALARIDQGRYAEALDLARRALQVDRLSPAWNEAAGSAARLAGDADGALPYLRRAAELSPDDAAVWLELALASGDGGNDAESRDAFVRALAISPRWERARWAHTLALPRIVKDDAQAERALAMFDEGLDRLHPDLDAALATVPFNLHYLPGDHTSRQRRFASLVARSVRSALPQLAEPMAAQPRAGRRVRVGFVSAYLRHHVVERFFGRFVTDLDPREFERWVWFTGESADDRTREIERSVDTFIAGAPAFGDLARSIRAAELDVLVYLDVGLDARQLALASLPLAPVQAALYGHPVTSGLDSVDFFLSGELLETESSQEQYTEKLVRLPGLGMRPARPPAPSNDRWLDSLRDNSRPVVFCAQNLAKIQPAFDDVLASILAASGARLVLIDRGAGLTAKFRERFEPKLAARRVDTRAALRFEPLRAYRDYLAGVAAADLILDTPGFSGGGTSLDAFAVGAPVLAFEGASARARQTSAMLRMMELPELIARDANEYAGRAIALLGAPGDVQALRGRIRERSTRIFDDARPVASFAAFLRGS